MTKYAGITIGPIFDTIMDAANPASLWFASSIFSDITKRICSAILKEPSFKDIKIYSPYFTEADCDQPSRDGIGKYHDRIIFSASELNRECLNELIRKVKRNTVKALPEKYQNSEDFFDTYLQIHYCILDESEVKGNCILALSPYLDALELMKTFPQGKVSNPFLRIFLGEKEDKGYENANYKIKGSRLFRDIVENNQLKKGDNIRSIPDISTCDEGFKGRDAKYLRYFAVVNADGDRMGKFLENLSSDEVTVFSKGCLDYVKEITGEVKKYGGMTIYAGGDDLLFLAPVKGADGRTVFELCADINERFRKRISQDFNKDIPTISFGISIQYIKFPLYEALALSRDMLWKVKSPFSKKPDSQAILLQKHSGQSLEIIAKNDRCTKNQGFSKILEETTEGDTVQSVLYTLRNFGGYMDVLIKKTSDPAKDPSSKQQFITGWMNLFDNEGQEMAKNYIRNLADVMYDEVVAGNGIEVPDQKDNKLDVITAILQLKKFMIEKVSEDEHLSDSDLKTLEM